MLESMKKQFPRLLACMKALNIKKETADTDSIWLIDGNIALYEAA